MCVLSRKGGVYIFFLLIIFCLQKKNARSGIVGSTSDVKRYYSCCMCMRARTYTIYIYNT